MRASEQVMGSIVSRDGEPKKTWEQPSLSVLSAQDSEGKMMQPAETAGTQGRTPGGPS